MDPNEALFNIIDSALSGDRDAFADACEALTGWIEMGGPRPTGAKVFDLLSLRLGWGDEE